VSSVRVRTLAASALVAALVPIVLVGNGVHVIAHDWFVRFEYDRSGFPADPYGLSRDARTELALTGLQSVQPHSDEGVDLLRRARLPTGARAFGGRELRHMQDVRRLLGGLYGAHLIALLAVSALVIWARPMLFRGLRWGAVATLALAAATGVAVLVDVDAYLAGFHRIFFEGDSWRFADQDTLRRLYPDRFWEDTAKLLTAGAVAQALLLVGADRLWAHRAKLQTAPWRSST